MSVEDHVVGFAEFESVLAGQGVTIHEHIQNLAAAGRADVRAFCFTPTTMLRAVLAAGELLREREVPPLAINDSLTPIALPEAWANDMPTQALANLVCATAAQTASQPEQNIPMFPSTKSVVPTTCRMAEFYLLNDFTEIRRNPSAGVSRGANIIMVDGQATILCQHNLGLTLRPVMAGDYPVPTGAWIAVNPPQPTGDTLSVMDKPAIDISLIRLSTLLLPKKAREAIYGETTSNKLWRTVIAASMGEVAAVLQNFAIKQTLQK